MNDSTIYLIIVALLAFFYLSRQYVGKKFEIDCIDIEIYGFEDFRPPIFKGPGVIRGDKVGRLKYKIYNQIQVNKEIFDYLKLIKESDDPKKR